MYIYAALLDNLLFFFHLPLCSHACFLFREGVEEQGGTGHWWMRVNSCLSQVWAELSQGEKGVEES